MTVEKRVAHQHTRRDGFTYGHGRCSGASEYSVMLLFLLSSLLLLSSSTFESGPLLKTDHARQPP